MEDDNNLIQNAEGYVCTDCGTDVSENDKVCPKCGADLTNILEPEEAENVQLPSTNQITKPRNNTFHSERHYKTAFTLAKIVEFISWFILFGGVISGVVVASKSSALGIILILLSIIFGLLLVFLSQLTLIFIDTENNTRKTANEITKTNAMLADTLGTIASSLNKIVKNAEVEK